MAIYEKQRTAVRSNKSSGAQTNVMDGGDDTNSPSPTNNVEETTPPLRNIAPGNIQMNENTGVAGGMNDGGTALSSVNAGNPMPHGNREGWRDWWMGQGAMNPQDAKARFTGAGGTMLGGNGYGRSPYGDLLDFMINLRGAEAGQGMVTPGWTASGGGGMGSIAPGATGPTGGTTLPQEAQPLAYQPSQAFQDRLRQREAGYGNIVRAQG